MTHRDGFPQFFGQRFSARSAWRGGAGHREPCGTPPETPGPQDWGKPPAVARANRRGRREALTPSGTRGPRIACGPLLALAAGGRAAGDGAFGRVDGDRGARVLRGGRRPKIGRGFLALDRSAHGIGQHVLPISGAATLCAIDLTHDV